MQETARTNLSESSSRMVTSASGNLTFTDLWTDNNSLDPAVPCVEPHPWTAPMAAPSRVSWD